MTDDVVLELNRATHPHTRAPFEKERGVTSVTEQGPYAFLTAQLDPKRPRAGQELEIYHSLAEARISVNLVKLHRGGLSFVVEQSQAEATLRLLEAGGYRPTMVPAVSMVSVYAAGMRSLSGVMARIARALLQAGIAILQTGDGPDIVFCLVDAHGSQAAVDALRSEFGVGDARPRIVVQKFGGRSVGTAEARRLAAERVREAIEAGYRPVVVVSAIGRMGEPYATDTLLSHLEAVDPNTEPPARERDLLMACGEIISTVIMAQTLKSIGLSAVALTGAQAGIVTDYRYGDAQILDINPTYILEQLVDERVDVVVVAGFQGATEQGAITTLGRGGSDTTAAALGAALRAERVEIYTHVDGVKTADPEVVPEARTLPVISYEEVANMAHQGAKVLHPRAAEIAMLHQIPLWVKSSFERARGTLVAPLTEVEPQTKHGVTGIATISTLVYFTMTGLDPAGRAEVECQVYQATGDAGISFYLNSVGPETSSFLVEQAAAGRVELLLRDLGVAFDVERDCELVSVVAVNMWEEPGFLRSIAQVLFGAGIGMLQYADNEGSVSCLLARADARNAVRSLHHHFRLGE